ncbi:MAG: hypothetical protein R3B09_18720 [Nannocystaceae bacterium]
MLASSLGSALLALLTLTGEISASTAHDPAAAPAALTTASTASAWWGAVTEVEPILCPVVDRRYGVRALCGVALYLDVDSAGELRDLKARVAGDLAAGTLAPGAPPVGRVEVVAVDDGRAAVVARVKGRRPAAALLRWAKGLVSGGGPRAAGARSSR